MFTQSILERPKKPLIIISSHEFIFHANDHPFDLYKDEYRTLIYNG